MNDRTNQIEAELEQDRARLRDDIEALSERLNPRRFLDEATGAIGKGSGAFAAGLGAQVRDNPMPAILTGVGLAWLILGDRRRGHDNGRAYDRDYLDYNEELDAHSAWENYQETSWALIRDPDEDDAAWDRRLTEGRARCLGVERVDNEDHAGFKRRVGEAADKTKRFAMRFRDRLGRAARGVSGAATHATDAAKSGMHAAGDAAGGAARRSAEFYDGHPLTSGALGLALGALLGSALPLSRLEEEKLKGAIDEGLDRGAEKVDQAARAVKTFAEDVESTVRQ